MKSLAKSILVIFYSSFVLLTFAQQNSSYPLNVETTLFIPSFEMLEQIHEILEQSTGNIPLGEKQC